MSAEYGIPWLLLPVCCNTAFGHGTSCATIPAPTPPATSPCPSDTTAYTCPGISIPDQSDRTIACESGTIEANASSVTFCCFPFASTACTVDHDVRGCNVAGFYGFSCTGSTRPEAADAALKCSVGTAGVKGATEYCCTRD
jgi:hypothetical protein